MPEIKTYEPEPMTDIDAACRKAIDLSIARGAPIKLAFNSVTVDVAPDDTPAVVAERLWQTRHARDREVVGTITVEVARNKSFTVRMGEHFYDELCFDEMLGCLVRLMIDGNPRPEKAGYGGLKTAEQWEQQRKAYSEIIHNDEVF